MENFLNNILVAIDLKPSDNELIKYAIELASKFNSHLWIIHITAPPPDFIGYTVGPTYIRDLLAEEFRKEHRELGEIATRLKEKSLRAEALLVQGPTVSSLDEEIKKLNIDLIIMGSHKRGFLYEMLMGDTSSVKLIKKTSIPVLTIPLSDEL